MTLYTEPQAAELLTVPVKTLRNARYRHKIAYVKYGKEVRYSQKHLDDYTALCERKAGGASCDSSTSSSKEKTVSDTRFTGVNLASLDFAQRGRMISQKLKSSSPISS